MSILYDLYSSPTASESENENTTPKYHARVVNRQTLDPKVLIDNICQRCSLGKGDVVALFEELSNEIKRELLAGNSVYLPKLGLFSLSLQTLSNANPKSTRAEQIRVKRIEFRAESRLRRDIIHMARFERSPEKVHSAVLSNEKVNALVCKYLNEHAFLTRKALSELCHFTKGTALNHIRRLVNEEIIENTNTHHQPIYVLKKN